MKLRHTILGVPAGKERKMSSISSVSGSIGISPNSSHSTSRALSRSSSVGMTEACPKSSVRNPSIGPKVRQGLGSSLRSLACAMISIVGRDMAGKPGVSGRLLSALGRAGISVRMIVQGTREINITVGVNEQDYEKAVYAVHGEFFPD